VNSYTGVRIFLTTNFAIKLIYHVAWKVAESAAYYEKKRAEGKKHNQALRSLGRHLVRVLWKMIQAKRSYFISSNEKIA
jgi:hypothetical protein